jgi:hypothetical protein
VGLLLLMLLSLVFRLPCHAKPAVYAAQNLDEHAAMFAPPPFDHWPRIQKSAAQHTFVCRWDACHASCSAVVPSWLRRLLLLCILG